MTPESRRASSPFHMLLVLLAADPSTGSLPSWYTSNRIHAHTRLTISKYCREDSGGLRACDPIFDHAGAAFSALKVPVYVRHTHTGRDGPWWPSTTDPPESWHPLVQATNRSLPNEFLAEAATAGVKVIAYHYMKASNFYAKAQPSWYLDQSVAQRLRDHVAARSGHVRVRARLAGHLHRASGAACADGV